MAAPKRKVTETKPSFARHTSGMGRPLRLTPPVKRTVSIIANSSRENERLGRLHGRGLSGDVDVLALAGVLAFAECDQRGLGGLGTGMQGGLGEADPQGCAVAVADDRHLAGGGDDSEVAVEVAGLGTVVPESADRDVDERRVGLGELVVAESERGEDAGAFGLDENVGGGGELPEPIAAYLGIEVGGHRALVARVGPPGERVVEVFAVAGEGTEASRTVALGRLDGDDIGAEVGEDHAGDQASFIGEVEDSVVAQHDGAPLVKRSGRRRCAHAIADVMRLRVVGMTGYHGGVQR